MISRKVRAVLEPTIQKLNALHIPWEMYCKPNHVRFDFEVKGKQFKQIVSFCPTDKHVALNIKADVMRTLRQQGIKP